ncbi:MAG: hypothetical protein HFH41_01565 [Lachnospiraceae bacterium]|nr:hypothetical protein [Lachnospiraceae bacterium]
MKAVRKIFTQIRGTFKELYQRFQNCRQQNWKDTTALLYWCSVFLSSFSVGLLAGSFMRPVWMGFLLVFLLTFLLTVLGLWILEKVLKLFLRNGIREMLAFLLLFFLCAMVMTTDVYVSGMEAMILSAFVFSLLLALFLKSLWAVLRHKVRTKTIFVSLALTGIPVLAVFVLWMGYGFQDSYIERYLALEQENSGASRQENREGEEGFLTEQEQTDFLKEMEEGPYTVLTASYGTDKTDDLNSGTVDISRFAQNKGINGYFKEKYQGYPLTEVPMKGMVWYPKEVSDCPALFLIHGNHSWLVDSYLGYEYLGNYLASHGYVVISVDENACNGLSGENDGRAVLLLENMRQVETYNRQKGNPLYQKIDYDNLALAGHSRGGEAAAAACLFNDLDYYPDNGNWRFQYHFSIQSLIAIAPTCGQYEPSDRSVKLQDVNYLALHGANDQDVTTFMGMEQYENISFSGEKDCIKTSLYAAGCNHGQFNSLWGKYDIMEPMNRMLNVANFLPQQEQQKIAKIFIRSFLDQTLNQNTKPIEKQEKSAEQRKTSEQEKTGEITRDLLTDCKKYQSLLPKTLYVQSYETSDLSILCDFEEDTRLETGSLEGVKIRADHVRSWREEQMVFSTEEDRGNYGAVLSWERVREDGEGEKEKSEERKSQEGGLSGEMAELCISLPKPQRNIQYLQFDLMDLREDFSEEEVSFLEVEVGVADSHGKEVWLEGDVCEKVYPAFPVRLNKLQYLWRTAEYKHQFQTLSIPISEFEGIGPEEISEIRLRFPQSEGKAAIDNIGVR